LMGAPQWAEDGDGGGHADAAEDSRLEKSLTRGMWVI
jgi:hypothetical protein